MSLRDSRADWCCPGCDSSDVFHKNGTRYECEDCGKATHEAVGEIAGDLQALADGGDTVAKLADRLLETGGVPEE